MKYKVHCCALFFVMLVMSGAVMAEPLVLKASKDTFGRGNSHRRNSGASPTLYVSNASNIRSIIAFDLENVTNRIVRATFRFQQQNTVEAPLDLTVAPMVQTSHNAVWKEGGGVLASKGQVANPGEACYGWSSFPDVQWEDASGDGVSGLGAPQLWTTPIASQAFPWQKGEWVEIKITNIQMLETIRQSKNPVVTFGLWGTSGNGLYFIASRESGHAPELVLSVKDAGIKVR